MLLRAVILPNPVAALHPERMEHGGIMERDDIGELLARVALRDRSAFSLIYQKVSPKLFAICLRMLKDRGDAEEALQDVFVRIWDKAGSYTGDGLNAYGWLCAITRYRCIDRLRARRPEGADLDEAEDLADLGPDPEQTAMLRSEGARIDTCMEALDPDRARAVRQAYVEGLSYQELAETYAVPLNTMRTWLRRSLLKLRECMDEHARPEQG